MLKALFAGIVAWFALAAASFAQEVRVALVIGNAGYQNVSPLANPVNDATDLGNPGPDFKFGYGKVDALESTLTVKQNSYHVELTGISTGNKQLARLREQAAEFRDQRIKAGHGLLAAVQRTP